MRVGLVSYCFADHFRVVGVEVLHLVLLGEALNELTLRKSLIIRLIVVNAQRKLTAYFSEVLSSGFTIAIFLLPPNSFSSFIC